ncbi:glutaredoxin family protein [Corynebacterium macclintockiae]|uniref:Glutaredoxin family protein n=1 Tax=Corynebacterium macclintockiae TaxID=2913501 RepID=A0A9X3M658_9CORY|nr:MULTISPECIES: glutaredoxin family protein [Corynebacterium]MCZ9304704.1 glutaredoxin family protein [Corynebacterium macclintockiae]MDK8870388.1 glutaredoxin family protein [Corynebacterium macclintockiae]MDK8890730.1 glutaredoxin family protein [Corynebacterium macclintockiae]
MSLNSLSAGSEAKARVQLITRSTCGSCERVHQQILPIAHRYGTTVEVIELDRGGVTKEKEELAQEFGDRVPVVLVDDEEVACWEIDDDELIAALEQ